MDEEKKIKKYENVLFKKLLVRHKKMIVALSNISNYESDSKEFGILKPIDNDALMLCLYDADFKCQYPGCGSEDYLTTHHFIQRHVKEIINLKRYLLLRHYWANQIILCKDHHDEIDNCVPKHINKERYKYCLSEDKIAYIKNKFKQVSNGGK